MASHGDRRAAEMEQVRRDPARSSASTRSWCNSTVARQREMGAIGKQETVRAALKSGRAAILGADKRGGQRQALTPTSI